ncbi:MAG: MobF family relaxase [Solirubrobacteraceae bacterium]
MSLTPMSPRSWRYYVREIAAGREDYYAHEAERSGKFVGRGAEMLGIAHQEADALALERLFGHGADPRSGVPLGRGFDPGNERAVAGFALTFSPPKSVSVLWALGNERASAEVLAAHEAAVAASLSFVEQHAAFTRRGHNGTLQVDTEGLLAAASSTGPRERPTHSSTPTSSSPTRCVPKTVPGSHSTAASSTRRRKRPGCSTRPRYAPS